jgi:signal transduction histidine kinase
MVINAADAIEDKGRHGTVTVTSRVDCDDAVITIADTGSGIPEDLQLRIFEPFFTTKDVGRGTGQGLALARAVVQEQHGGRITLSSQLGVGSTFTIRIPINGPRDRGEPA